MNGSLRSGAGWTSARGKKINRKTRAACEPRPSKTSLRAGGLIPGLSKVVYNGGGSSPPKFATGRKVSLAFFSFIPDSNSGGDTIWALLRTAVEGKAPLPLPRWTRCMLFDLPPQKCQKEGKGREVVEFFDPTPILFLPLTSGMDPS